MVGKLRMARAVADDLGNEDFVIIARTDGLSAVDAPEPARGHGAGHRSRAALSRLRHARTSSGASSRRPTAGRSRSGRPRFASASRRREFAFNWSSSFKWFRDPNPITFAELGELGFKFIFITLGGQHAMGHGFSELLTAMAERQEQGYIELQRREWDEWRGLADPQPPPVQRRALPPPGGQDVRLGPARAASSSEDLPEDKVV